jgi:hypothetical protein
MKTMSLVYDENEWTSYVSVVMKSEIHEIELIARMVTRNDVGDESSRSPTLPEAVAEQHVECGIVHTQLSQEADTNAEEPPFIASNETLLNVEHVCGSVGVGDVLPKTCFISGVDPQPIATRFVVDVDSSFMELEFMLEYKAMFGDECVEHSTDDRPVPELSKMNKALLQRALVEYAPKMPDFWDLSQAHRSPNMENVADVIYVSTESANHGGAL